ncbi:MAG: transcription-repair coupling factor [Clostridia bacterium]|nr:transcription-repair coupling factor [Clostridia bacterium]
MEKLMNFKNLLSEYQEYSDFCAALKKGKTPISAAGVVQSAMPQFIFETAGGRRTLVITYSDLEAKQLVGDMEMYTENVFLFPAKEYVFFNIDAQNRHDEHTRLKTLLKLKQGGGIAVTSLEALLQFTIPPEKLEEYTLELDFDSEYDIEELAQKLVKMGYVREEEVSGKGQFALRGGILDVYSPQCENPVRVEFFDTQIDSMREFDSVTQRSIDAVSKCCIIPCRELIDYAKSELSEKLSEAIKKLKRKKTDQSALIENLEADIEILENNGDISSICRHLGVIFDRIPTIIDYFDSDSLIFLIEPKRIAERAKTLEWEQGEIIEDLAEKGLLLPDCTKLWASYAETAARLQNLPLVSLNSLTHSAINYTYNSIFNFVTKTTVSLHGKVEYLYDDLQVRRKNGSTVVVLASNRSRGENLAGTLNEKGIKCRYIHDDAEFEKGEIVIVRGDAGKGFEYPDLNFILISDREIFDAVSKKSRRRMENTSRLKSYTDINVGDYVVHRSHGIGEYKGIKKMSVGGITKDYLHIAYRGTDSLYVPVDQLDMLYKYSGGSEVKLRLNKLGGSEWSKTKQKVRAATGDMAKQLVALYAEREHTKGHAFPSDTPWQRNFEDTFLYQETEDQLRSIDEVKRDMESEKPMDRLLCGDVGYGKTEVALRAAFKAATDSKQVAYLCPTTILAMQQYETFTKRMQNFPVKVEMLSRFRTPGEQKKILKKLKTGEIDIIIGTHRILQKDLEFKDLGLLIIDEEQRFGVAHKERLKELKKNVDVLSMTATPIPRTLHMAMVSVRDMSLLETPPENRYPVATYVLEYNPGVLIDAMKKELSRGGQVFYLYNRVQGIYRVAEWIKSQLPDANVAVGHGKMHEDELEDIMYDMVNGKTDILVCTTIIETGLDIPNANTIIIENADKMGLSQLYQLRGRVGRSTRSAYAYLTYKKDGILSEVAEKRLSAIREFTEFGSGFKIAMRDLEIRGAGDILGAEQHGHIDSVGYDMYCKILSESVREVQGISEGEELETTVDIKVDAFIPERYIKSNNVRIDTYKRIAALENEDDASELTDELIDRFGDIPSAAANLIEIALIKALAHNIGICDVTQKGEIIVMEFADGAFLPEFVQFIIENYPKNIMIGASSKPTLKYKCEAGKKLLSNIKFLLQQLNELHTANK